MLERWIMTGLEISRVVEEFTGANDNDDDEELPYHEEGCASQDRFQRPAKDLLEVLLNKGNHLVDGSSGSVRQQGVCLRLLPYLSVWSSQSDKSSTTISGGLCLTQMTHFCQHRSSETTYCCSIRRKHKKQQLSRKCSTSNITQNSMGKLLLN